MFTHSGTPNNQIRNSIAWVVDVCTQIHIKAYKKGPIAQYNLPIESEDVSIGFILSLVGKIFDYYWIEPKSNLKKIIDLLSLKK